MASLEFIQKRIEGKEKEIATLEKKMGRILAAQASGWEKNPYWYREEDIKYTQRDIDNAKKALDEYRAQLEEENNKAASRNIPAILEFLEGWKERVKQYYRDSFDRYLIARAEWYEYDSEYTQKVNSGLFHKDREAYNKLYKEHESARKQFRSNWNFILDFIDHRQNPETFKYEDFLNEAKLQKVLDEEAKAKYDFIVDRTCKIVTVITDASGLRVGEKGDLNGIIIGTDGKAKVETIGAGGYNIQCFHFRTLIHEVK